MTRRSALAFLVLAAAACAPSGRPAAMPATQAGLWFGPVHLCRDTVAQALAGLDPGGMPVFTVSLDPKLAPMLRRETGSRVGQAFPVRIDGRIVAEPVVREAITGGRVQISGFAAEETERIRAAAVRPC